MLHKQKDHQNVENVRKCAGYLRSSPSLQSVLWVMNQYHIADLNQLPTQSKINKSTFSKTKQRRRDSNQNKVKTENPFFVVRQA